MKRKKLLLATTAIAASLAMGSASAGQSDSENLGWSWSMIEDSDNPSQFFDGIAPNNGTIYFASNKAAMAVPKALRINSSEYKIIKYGNRFAIESIAVDYVDNPMNLADYLAGNVDRMSNRRLGNLYTALSPAIILFDSQPDGKNFTKSVRNIVSASCPPAHDRDEGCQLVSSNAQAITY
jgi:hypothetical protein